ncbi:MAG: hypothetical protein K2K64_07750 [Muribaculaceae bacterium]|nr:hypothetical protein [Muribaculaceae bacterium]MDE7109021.1 hypothetical protein [Muribaculaceae bacterium]
MKVVPALLTLVVGAVVVLLLMLVRLQAVMPVVPAVVAPTLYSEEEELFVEPELTDLGEPESMAQDAPAPAVKGDPAPSEVEQPEVKVAAEEPKPVPPAPKEVTQKKKETPVKAPEPSGNDKEVKEATSAVANKFSSKNGNPSGNESTSAGVGGTGVGIAGSAHGRTFQGCPKPDVALRHKTVVKVNVVIDAEGRVTEATATGSADASIRRKCEAAARQARWSAKKGATPTRGVLTFTIMPK